MSIPFDLHGLTLAEAVAAYPEQAAIIIQKQAMELAQRAHTDNCTPCGVSELKSGNNGIYLNDEWERNRGIVIQQENDLFVRVKSLEGQLCLNLGCGTRLLDGFVNVDKYSRLPNVNNYDIFTLPYGTEVDVIFCAHVLEHLPIRHAKMAVKEWGRVMKDRGMLYLGIPDIEYVMSRLLDKDLDPQSREFLMYVLFGFQTNPGNRGDRLDFPVDQGQFHTCGYTKETIKEELENAGFRCVQILNYDGWSTPSIWVVAERISR